MMQPHTTKPTASLAIILYISNVFKEEKPHLTLPDLLACQYSGVCMADQSFFHENMET
jgi:hypothetical protein